MSEVLNFRYSHLPMLDENSYFIQVSTDLLAMAVSEKAKILYLHLLTFCKRKQNQCWPSQALLMERTTWAETTIRRALRELEAAEMITIHPPRPPLRSHNIYELHIVAQRYTPPSNQTAPPIKPDRPPHQTRLYPPSHVMGESHEESHDYERESDQPLVEPDLSQKTSRSGYVALLKEVAGSEEAAIKIAGLVHPDRDEDYVKRCVEYSKTRHNPPGWLTTVFKSNGLAPSLQGPPGAARSGKKVTGYLKPTDCPRCTNSKLPEHKYCRECQIELLSKSEVTE